MTETATAPSDAGATGIGSTVYGGQAVIEGVMMRSRDRAATAVRRADGSIVIDSAAVEPGRLAAAVRRIPVLRGTFALWDVFNLGARSLAFSARATLEDEQGQPGEPGDDGGAWIPLMMGFGLALGVVLFFLVPLGLTALTDRWIESDLLSNIVEGLIRVSVVVGYLAAISLLPDIYRTLQYHGAEHKTVNAVEAGLELIPSNVQRQSLLHPRCGTSFLLLVVVISIVGFALLGRPELWIRLTSRIVIIPFAAGIGYELIRLLANHREQAWARVLTLPGYWLQGLTTREPDDEQCEVAIAAIGEVLVGQDRDLVTNSGGLETGGVSGLPGEAAA